MHGDVMLCRGAGVTPMSRSTTLVKPCTTTTALDQMPAFLSGRQAGLKELVLVNLGLDVGDLGIEHRVEQDGARLDVAVHDDAMPDMANDVHLRRELTL